MSVFGNEVKKISGLIERLWKKFDCPGHFTLNFLRKTVSTVANEIGNENDIEMIDRYIKIIYVTVINFQMFIILLELFSKKNNYIFRKLLHQKETARRSYNAPTNAIALKERDILDSIIESGKISFFCSNIFYFYFSTNVLSSLITYAI